MKGFCWLIMVIAFHTAAHADGGHVRFQQLSGPFIVTLFTAPEPLTTGEGDFSVMIQDHSTQQVILDASVDVLLHSSAGESETVHLIHNSAGNRLLEAATVRLPVEGIWTAKIIVHRGVDQASCTTNFIVERGSSRRRTVIIFLMVPLLGIALFLTQQAQRDRDARIVKNRPDLNASASIGTR